MAVDGGWCGRWIRVGSFILRASELAVIALTLHFGGAANTDNVRYEVKWGAFRTVPHEGRS